MAHVRFLHAHQHHAQHVLGCGEQHQPLALALDPDHAGVVRNLGAVIHRQEWRTAGCGMVDGLVEVLQHSGDEHAHFCLIDH